ncbi:MAG: CarD family transcriptional regulator, partial [Acutalibacteraceae bacterium]|nr:CarD family transcriptional regulator [Acutalibacteraceae bacterium]
MQFLTKIMGEIPSLKQIFDTVTGEGVSPVAVFGIPDTARAILSVAMAKKLDKPVFVVTDTEATARKMAADAISVGGKADVFPSRDYAFLNTLGSSREYEHQRISALWRLINGETQVIFVDIEAFTQKTVSPIYLRESAQIIKVGDQINLKILTEKLINSGYDFTEQVDGVGQFSVRGGIIDIFSLGCIRPVRIELWGDEVDSMAFFDPEDQRRMENCEELTLLPAAEFSISNENLAKILSGLLEKKAFKSKKHIELVYRDIDRLQTGGSVNIDRYMNILPNSAVFLDEYLKNSVLILSENRNVFSRLKSLEESRLTLLEDLFEGGIIDSGDDNFFIDRNELSGIIAKTPTIYADSFTGSSYPVAPKSVSTAFIKQLSCWGGSMDVLLDDLRPAIKRGQSVVILSGGEKGADILLTQLENNGIHPQKVLPDDIIVGRGVFVMPTSLSAGLEFSEQNLLVIAHKPINLATKKKRHKKGESFNSLEELKVGDYVVHFAHGIGQFDGIHRIETGNVVKDYIKIKYRGTDVLYVPVTQLDLVSRYIGTAGENGPLLHRLGSQDWQKAKARVRAAVKDMAKELTKLYGERLKVQGYAFGADNE